jgi:hypothetical protein
MEFAIQQAITERVKSKLSWLDVHWQGLSPGGDARRPYVKVCCAVVEDAGVRSSHGEGHLQAEFFIPNSGSSMSFSEVVDQWESVWGDGPIPYCYNESVAGNVFVSVPGHAQADRTLVHSFRIERLTE